jgi:hypothetical protein
MKWLKKMQSQTVKMSAPGVKDQANPPKVPVKPDPSEALDLMPLDDDLPAGLKPKPASWWTVIAWFLLISLIVTIAALLIWWVVATVSPSAHCGRDIDVRDLQARNVEVSGNVSVGGDLTVGATTTEAAAIIKALSLPPIANASLTIVLDGTQSSVMLTNTSASVPQITLPSAVENAGLIVAIFNESGSGTFSVSPAGTDKINGAAGPVTPSSFAVFVSMGLTPSGFGDWKRII